MLKIIWYSTVPFSSVGYGNATREILRRFRKEGHEVKIATKHALGGSIVVDGVECFDGGEKDLINIIRQEDKYDYIISMCDDWALGETFTFDKWVNCCYLDTHRMHPRQLKASQRAMHTIAMSKFTKGELERNGRECFYAPLGVTTSTFKPDMKYRTEFRDSRFWKDDMFVIGSLGLNYSSDRKNFIGLLQAFTDFYKKHPDSLLYLHTDIMGTTNNGLNLKWIINDLGFNDDGTGPIQYAIQKPYHLWELSEEAVIRTYNAFDVFCFPTMGEGFGMPIIEAQSCFPKGTKISAENIYKTHVHKHTGELIEITTTNKKIEVTPEHPFWTGNSWTLAKDLHSNHQLWYNNTIINEEAKHVSKRLSEIWEGDIERVIGSIQNNALKRGRSESRNVSWKSPMASISVKSKEDTITKTGIKMSPFIRSRVGIFSRIDRWGWNNYNKKTVGERQQLETDDRGMQHFVGSYQLVDKENKLAQYSCRSKTNEGLFWEVLRFLGNRNIFSSFISKIREVSDYKKEPMSHTLSLVRRTIESENTRKDFTEAGNSYTAYEDFKPETILSIRRRQVKDFPVYNLSTLSGMYVAEGFLVHNCGIPAILSDTTSCKELLRGGWLIDCENRDLEYSSHLTWIMRTASDKIVDKLELAYAEWKSGKIRERGIQAREGVLEYDWDTVYKEHWKPIFDCLDLEKQGKMFKIEIYPDYKSLYHGFGSPYQVGNCENFVHDKICLDIKMPRLPNEPEDDPRPLLIRSYPIFPDSFGEFYVDKKCPVHTYLSPGFVNQCRTIWKEVLSYPIIRKEVQKVWEERVKNNADYIKLSETIPVFNDGYSSTMQTFITTVYTISSTPKEFIQDCDSFVDIGCGRGSILKELKQLKPQAVIKGTEINNHWIDGETVVYGDVLALPFKDEEFDCVFSIDVLEHTSDPLKALSELFRISKKKVIIGVTPLEHKCFEEDITHIVKWSFEQWKREINEFGNIKVINPDNYFGSFLIEKR